MTSFSKGSPDVSSSPQYQNEDWRKKKRAKETAKATSLATDVDLYPTSSPLSLSLFHHHHTYYTAPPPCASLFYAANVYIRTIWYGRKTRRRGKRESLAAAARPPSLVSFPRRRIDSPVIAFATAASTVSRERRSETIGATFRLKGSRI